MLPAGSDCTAYNSRMVSEIEETRKEAVVADFEELSQQSATPTTPRQVQG